jgi:NAD(P)-dependent dehydrogenase (short-subunit alcohol dehydrogenase family)
MEILTGRVAFITGGVSGIGLGIAQALLSAGMKTVLTYRRLHHLEEALRTLESHRERIHTIRLDVADRTAMQRAADEAEAVFGKVHVLVNNAGIGIRTKVREATSNDWDWALSVNVMGIVNGIRCFLPKICAHGEGGHIVSTASMSGLAIPRGSGLYATTKSAVIAMMEALRGELVQDHIGVSVFCPGLVSTNILETEDGRPAQYAEEGRAIDAETRAFVQQNVLSHGMDRLEAGFHVLEGIRKNRLFILSHPEFEPAIRERYEAILRSIPRTDAVPPGRMRAEIGTLSNPIYLDRLQ